MPNSEIEEICKKIYQKHQTALNLIFQYKPDIELEISKIVQNTVKSHDELTLDTSGKTLIRFISKSLDELIPLKGEGWTTSKRLLLFEFNNYDKKLVLRLYIGPGDNQIRNKLHAIAKKNTRLFNKSDRKIGTKWLAIYQKEFLKPKNYEESDIQELKDAIRTKFGSFLKDDFPKIERHIKSNW